MGYNHAEFHRSCLKLNSIPEKNANLKVFDETVNVLIISLE